MIYINVKKRENIDLKVFGFIIITLPDLNINMHIWKRTCMAFDDVMHVTSFHSCESPARLHLINVTRKRPFKVLSRVSP